MYRNCNTEHLRDYPSCYEECNNDKCTFELENSNKVFGTCWNCGNHSFILSYNIGWLICQSCGATESLNKPIKGIKKYKRSRK